MYVYSTYVRELKASFCLDTSKIIERTNNACEGRNSGLSRSSSLRPTMADLRDHLAIKFKADLISPSIVRTDLTAYDMFISLIQKLAPKNIKRIICLCSELPTIGNAFSDILLQTIRDIKFKNDDEASDLEEENAANEMIGLCSQYREFKKNHRNRHRSTMIVLDSAK